MGALLVSRLQMWFHTTSRRTQHFSQAHLFFTHKRLHQISKMSQTRPVVSCILAALLLIQMLVVTHSAPLAASEDSATSKLTVHFNNLAGELEEADTQLSRQKRHSSRHTSDIYEQAEEEANDLMPFQPLGDSEVTSRKRRSAAFFLSAAIKICDQHPLFCSSVSIEDEGVKVLVKISDE